MPGHLTAQLLNLILTSAFTISFLSTSLSGDIATSAMQEYLECPTVEALADDESESVHTEHSGCNTEKTASAPVPAEGVQPMLMHNSGELCMYACAPCKCPQLNYCDVLMCMQGVGLQWFHGDTNAVMGVFTAILLGTNCIDLLVTS